MGSERGEIGNIWKRKERIKMRVEEARGEREEGKRTKKKEKKREI